MIFPYGIGIEIEGDYSRSKSNKILPLKKCYLPYIFFCFFVWENPHLEVLHFELVKQDLFLL
jgi:hypothetical protein